MKRFYSDQGFILNISIYTYLASVSANHSHVPSCCVLAQEDIHRVTGQAVDTWNVLKQQIKRTLSQSNSFQGDVQMSGCLTRSSLENVVGKS